MELRFFDSHAHLNNPKFSEDAAVVRQQAQDGGVTALLNAGYDLSSSALAMKQASELEGVWASVGMHPHDAKDYDKEAEGLFREWAKNPKVVAIGEIGLDYYYEHSPRETQRAVFIRQMILAKELGKPIIIHDRDAHGEVLELVQEHGKGLTGVFHCYSGSKEFAQEVLKLGFYVSFAGPVTYKSAKNLKEAAQSVPLNRILIETDCPYLTPEPFRGKRNEPLYVKKVAEEIARLRNISVEEVANHTFENTCRLFGIKL